METRARNYEKYGYATARRSDPNRTSSRHPYSPTPRKPPPRPFPRRTRRAIPRRDCSRLATRTTTLPRDAGPSSQSPSHQRVRRFTFQQSCRFHHPRIFQECAGPAGNTPTDERRGLARLGRRRVDTAGGVPSGSPRGYLRVRDELAEVLEGVVADADGSDGAAAARSSAIQATRRRCACSGSFGGSLSTPGQWMRARSRGLSRGRG